MLFLRAAYSLHALLSPLCDYTRCERWIWHKESRLWHHYCFAAVANLMFSPPVLTGMAEALNSQHNSIPSLLG